MDTRALLYYKLTLWALGSGELKYIQIEIRNRNQIAYPSSILPDPAGDISTRHIVVNWVFLKSNT